MATEKRLIDANAYKASLTKWKEDAWKHNERHDAMLIADCLSELELMSTVDAVEVVHGRWIHVPSSDMMTGKAYKCSECNKMRYGSYMPNYCQCCGAKMDGDGM